MIGVDPVSWVDWIHSDVRTATYCGEMERARAFLARNHLLPVSGTRQVVAVAYVLTMSALAGYEFSPGNSGVTTWLLLMVGSLPGLIVCLPPIYAVGAIAWTTADDSGRSTWVVAVTFALLFAATATVNVVCWCWMAANLSPSALRRSVSPSDTRGQGKREGDPSLR